MPDRLIAIGDIHGCRKEFADLVAKLELTKKDVVILLGDLVNRGPDSVGVIDLAREINAISLLGNHELRLLNFRRSGDLSLLKETDRETFATLRRWDWSYLESMPLTYYSREFDIVLVHGGFLPGRPWREQPAEVVTRVQVVNQDGKPRKRSEAPDAPTWADLWTGPPFAVYGHTPRKEVHQLKWSIGIDTACAMGGALTACILPEKKIVQVAAQRKYYG